MGYRQFPAWRELLHHPARQIRGTRMTSAGAATVFIIDDDASVRESIQDLLESLGLRSESFGTVEEFLRSKRPEEPSCLLLYMRLPAVNCLDFQSRLVDAC